MTAPAGPPSALLADRGRAAGVDCVVALDGVPGPGAVVEALPDPVPETAVFVFAHDGLVGLLGTAVARHAPCPACVCYHLATGTGAALPGAAGGPGLAAAEPYLRSDAFADALRAVAGPEHRRAVVVADPDGGEVRRRGTAWAHPACDHAAFPAGPEPGTTLPPDASALVDPAFGLVRRVEPVPVADDSPVAGLDVTASRTANPAYPADSAGMASFLHASGVADDPASARLRAVMEGVERASAMRPAVGTTTGTEAAVDGAVPPTAFYLYADEQYARDGFPCAPYDPTASHEWVPATEWATGERRRVPADLVSLVPRGGPDAPLVRTTTSGCAAHFSLPAAVRNGATELVERDAVVRHWYAREPRPWIRHDSLPGALAERVRAFEAEGFEVVLVDATRLPPFAVVEAFLLDPGGHPAVVSAAGCATDPAAAARDALREAADLYRSMAGDDPPPVPEFADVTGTNDHLAFYQDADRAAGLREFLDAGSTTGLGSVAGGGADLADDEVAGALADAGVRLLSVEIAHDAVAARGGRVVRTLSPDLVPVTFGRGRERLVRPADGRTVDRATDLPHPFA